LVLSFLFFGTDVSRAKEQKTKKGKKKKGKRKKEKEERKSTSKKNKKVKWSASALCAWTRSPSSCT
jgi:hypothetical protein